MHDSNLFIFLNHWRLNIINIIILLVLLLHSNMTNNTDTNNLENDSIDLNKIDKDITTHRVRAFLIIVLVVVLYLFLGDKTLPASAQTWGTFGDFIGGILNPIFALFAFYWLTYSVRLQIKELKDTRIELQKAANAQVETAKHQENIAKLEEQNVKTQQNIFELQERSLVTQIQATIAQQNQASIQNFESLFFQLLKTKNDSLNDIEYKEKNYNKHDNPINMIELKSVNAIKQHIIDFKNDHRGDWLNYYEEKMLDYTGSYFRICYQIVKLINKSEILKASLPKEVDDKFVYSSEQKEYFDIFRATLTKHEIEAFFFNCLNKHGNKKFKKLIEKYGLFEPLPIDHYRSSEKNHRLTRYAYQYESIIFEENPSWKIYFNEIDKIDIKIKLEDIESTFKNLKSISIINPSIIHSINSNLFEETSGFCYQFNGHINSKDIFNIFSEENLKSVKTSSLYTKLKLNIENNQKDIENTYRSIEERHSYFNKYNIENYNDEIPLIGFEEDRISINDLNNRIKKLKIEINDYKNQIKNLDDLLSLIQKAEATLTVFILIKYGISYTEFTDYIKLKQSISTLSSTTNLI